MESGVDSYAAELGARMEVLHRGGRRGARCALILLDATSPVQATRKFRVLSTRARGRRRLDTWLGTALVLEDEYDVVVYWWVGSHLEAKGGVGSFSVNACSRYALLGGLELCRPGHVPLQPSPYEGLWASHHGVRGS